MAAHFAVTSQEDQDCKMQTWSPVQRNGHFFRNVTRIRIDFAFLIFKGAKCAFEPPDERGANNAPDVSRIVVLGGGITNFLAIFIHHK